MFPAFHHNYISTYSFVFVEFAASYVTRLLPTLGESCSHDDGTHARPSVVVLLYFFVDMRAVCLMLAMMCCDVLRDVTSRFAPS